MRQQYEIDNFSDKLNANDFEFGNIAPGAEVLKMIKRFYYNRIFVDTDTRYADSTTETAAICFTDFFKDFKARRIEGYTRIFNMMKLDYDPLENYDRREEGEVVRTNVYGQKVNNTVDTQRNESTSTPKVQITAENYTTGFNEDTPHLAGKTVTSTNAGEGISDTIVSQNSGGVSVTETEHTDTETETRNNFRVHGNIGVTTPAQMILGELSIRERYDLIKSIVKTFIDEATFYC